MNFEDLRLRTLEQHMSYIGFVLAQGEYVIKISLDGAHFCKIPVDNKSQPAHDMHGWFVNPDMFLAAVRRLEDSKELVGIAGLKSVVAGVTLWYCLELPRAQAANAA